MISIQKESKKKLSSLSAWKGSKVYLVSGPQLTAKVPIRAPGKSIAPVPSSWFQLAIGQFPPSFAAKKFPTSSQQVQAVFHPVKYCTWLYLSLRLTKMDPNWSCTAPWIFGAELLALPHTAHTWTLEG